MYKISNVRLSERCDLAKLRRIASEILDISEASVNMLEIHKLSIDARRRTDVCFVYTLIVSVDGDIYKNSGNLKPGKSPKPKYAKARLYMQATVSPYTRPERYAFHPPEIARPSVPPIIVGTGPAGLFAALCLAEAGVKCTILERGQPVDQRIKSVEHFWRSGILNEDSNVQFGEGGAGTFSDGKLTTGLNDKRIEFILEQLVRFGAPEDILYLSKPHVGTDRLRGVIAGIRKRLLELGCDIRFGHKLVDVEISDGFIQRVHVDNGNETYSLSAETLILAPGNSARDTFEMLLRRGFKLIPKSFSVGVRIEHYQKDMDIAQYGQAAILGNVNLPASDYKLAIHLEGGRSVYTFCVCPGGQVVAAASEVGGVVTNGMSLYARDGENICGAVLVSVTPDDFGNTPLGGLALQRELERAAFVVGGSDYNAPAQTVGDFLEKRPSDRHGKITPTYLPGVKYCNLWDVLPEFICDAIHSALLEFSKRITGFAAPDAVMTAVETRSSSPVRIERNDYETIGIRGVFPCGEGAGYAGGIMSAAVDGIKCAEQVVLHLTQETFPK